MAPSELEAWRLLITFCVIVLVPPVLANQGLGSHQVWGLGSVRSTGPHGVPCGGTGETDFSLSHFKFDP